MLVGSVRERLDKEHAETGRAPTSTDGLLRQSSVSAKTIKRRGKQDGKIMSKQMSGTFFIQVPSLN